MVGNNSNISTRGLLPSITGLIARTPASFFRTFLVPNQRIRSSQFVRTFYSWAPALPCSDVPSFAPQVDRLNSNKDTRNRLQPLSQVHPKPPFFASLAMNFAFNLGALLFAAGLARNGLTQAPPSPLPDVAAIFGGLIPQVTALAGATASFANGGGSLTQALVCLTPVRSFSDPDLHSSSFRLFTMVGRL